MENQRGEYSTTAAYRGVKDSISKINNHTIMIFFGVIFILLAFIAFFSLCGYQTGSCDTSGTGSMVTSSFESSDGKSNTSAEVMIEFLIMLFTLVGVGMLTYVWTITRASKKLIESNPRQTLAALIINGKKDISPEDLKEAEKEELMTISAKMGIPASAIANAAESAKRGMAAPYNYLSQQYNKMKSGKSSKKVVETDSDDTDESDDSDESDNGTTKQKRKSDSKKGKK